MADLYRDVSAQTQGLLQYELLLWQVCRRLHYCKRQYFTVIPEDRRHAWSSVRYTFEFPSDLLVRVLRVVRKELEPDGEEAPQSDQALIDAIDIDLATIEDRLSSAGASHEHLDMVLWIADVPDQLVGSRVETDSGALSTLNRLESADRQVSAVYGRYWWYALKDKRFSPSLDRTDADAVRVHKAGWDDLFWSVCYTNPLTGRRSKGQRGLWGPLQPQLGQYETLIIDALRYVGCDGDPDSAVEACAQEMGELASEADALCSKMRSSRLLHRNPDGMDFGPPDHLNPFSLFEGVARRCVWEVESASGRTHGKTLLVPEAVLRRWIRAVEVQQDVCRWAMKRQSNLDKTFTRASRSLVCEMRTSYSNLRLLAPIRVTVDRPFDVCVSRVITVEPDPSRISRDTAAAIWPGLKWWQKGALLYRRWFLLPLWSVVTTAAAMVAPPVSWLIRRPVFTRWNTLSVPVEHWAAQVTHLEIRSEDKELRLDGQSSYVRLPYRRYWPKRFEKLKGFPWARAFFPAVKVPASDYYERVYLDNPHVVHYYTVRSRRAVPPSLVPPGAQADLGAQSHVVVRHRLSKTVAASYLLVFATVLGWAAASLGLALADRPGPSLGMAKYGVPSTLAIAALYTAVRHAAPLVAARSRFYLSWLWAAMVFFAVAVFSSLGSQLGWWAAGGGPAAWLAGGWRLLGAYRGYLAGLVAVLVLLPAFGGTIIIGWAWRKAGP